MLAQVKITYATFLIKRNQKRCDCLSNFGNCIPDLPCDANPYNYQVLKKSIHTKIKNVDKYDIRELK